MSARGFSPKARATTIDSLLALLQRQKAALCEGGRPDLAERAHIVIREDGLKLSFAPEPPTRNRHDPVVLKAMSLDPEFEATTGD